LAVPSSCPFERGSCEKIERWFLPAKSVRGSARSTHVFSCDSESEQGLGCPDSIFSQLRAENPLNIQGLDDFNCPATPTESRIRAAKALSLIAMIFCVQHSGKDGGEICLAQGDSNVEAH
jgi:hypothetical protein